MSAERLAFSDAESASGVVHALCRDLARGDVSFDVHVADEMLHFFLFSQGYPLEHAVAAYLDSGRQIWAACRKVLAWRFGSLAACGRMLDFASGYGRVTRHVVAEVPRESVWVSDIYAEGVAFQERAFGVHGVVSTSAPEDLRLATSFDAILVSSLFTHLPAARFRGWLRRLGAALSPRGVLVFSVHDLSLWHLGAPPAPDIVFVPTSESGSLSHAEYGSAWVSEDYVRAALAAELGECAVHRLPRALGNFQDLYVAIPAASAAALPTVGEPPAERGLDGVVEHCSRRGRHGLELSGWVADRWTGRPPRAVRVTLAGALAGACDALEPRSGPVYAADPITRLGWQVAVELPAGSGDGTPLGVSALTSDGQEIDLFSDTVLGAQLRTCQLDLLSMQIDLQQEAASRTALAVELEGKIREREAGIEALRRQIRGMEASRFWKLRNHWFRFKRLAGLSASLH